MKGLLLVLILLSPFILLGQARQKAMVDSIKAASSNIQKVSGLINKYPGTKVERIDVSDSDEYVTVVVRVHASYDRPISPISPASIVGIKMGGIAAHKLNTVIVPPLPFIFERDTIMALAILPVCNLLIGDISFAALNTVDVPPLPPVKVEMESLPFRAVTAIKMNEIVFDKMEAVPVPPLPLVKVEMDALPLIAVGQIKTGEIAFDKMEVVTVPPLPFVKVEVNPLPLVAVIEIKTDITVEKLPVVMVPPPPEIEPEVVIPFAAVIPLAIELRPRQKMHTVSVPSLVKEEGPLAEMHLSDEGYALLEKMEGFSPELYSLGDGGLTIGFGFFVKFNEADKWRKGVTWDDAERMMREKVPAYEDQVKKYINVPLTQEQFDALTMLAYNLGGFSKATSIVNDINSNADYEQLQRDWMRFVHSKAPGVMKGLMNRRNDELQVKNESNYQPERKVLIFKNKK